MGVFSGRSDRRRLSSVAVSAAILALMVGVFALTASAALAASGEKATSAGNQYNGVTVVKPAVAKQTKPTSGASNVAATKTSSSGLPFTGISLAGTVVLGIGLVGCTARCGHRGESE